MTIPVTWEDNQQPGEDEIAGNVWFWAETYRELQEGLKLAARVSPSRGRMRGRGACLDSAPTR